MFQDLQNYIICLTLLTGPFGVVCLGETLGEVLRKHWGISTMDWLWFCLYSNPEVELPHRGTVCEHMKQMLISLQCTVCVNSSLVLTNFLWLLYFCQLFTHICVWCCREDNSSPQLLLPWQHLICIEQTTGPRRGFPFAPNRRDMHLGLVIAIVNWIRFMRCGNIQSERKGQDKIFKHSKTYLNKNTHRQLILFISFLLQILFTELTAWAVRSHICDGQSCHPQCTILHLSPAADRDALNRQFFTRIQLMWFF